MSILKNMLMETTEYGDSDHGYAFESINCEMETIEACEQYNEIASDEEAIERLEDIAVGLESLIEIGEESLQEGGLTATNAALLNISAEALIAPLGISSPILSKESFGAEGERLTSTRVSVEGARETIEKIWNAIKRAMVALKQKLGTWYNNIFKVAEKLLKKNDAVGTEIGKLSGKVAKSDNEQIEFSAGSLLSKGQSSADLNDNSDNLRLELIAFLSDREVYTSVSQMVEKFNNVDFIEGGSNATSGFTTAIKGEIKKYTEISATAKSNDIPATMVISGFTANKFGQLPGNKALFSYYAENDFKSLLSSGWKIGPFKDANNASEKVKFDILTQLDMKKLIDINKIILETLIDYRKNKEAKDAVKEKIVKAGDNLSKSIKEAKGDKKDVTNARIALSVLKKLEKFLDSPANQLTNLAIKTASSTLNLIGMMIKVYE